MGKSIFPVGKPMGWEFNEKGELQYYEWFRGDDCIELTADEAVTALMAFSHYEENSELRFDRQAYFNFLKENSESHTDQDINSFLDNLLAKGILVEIDFSVDDIESFLRSYRIIPVGRGWGNTPEKPGLYGIGPADPRTFAESFKEPAIFVGGWVYSIWSISHADGSIWRGCELQAEHEENSSAMDVAREIVKSIPMLVATEFAHLEKI